VVRPPKLAGRPVGVVAVVPIPPPSVSPPFVLGDAMADFTFRFGGFEVLGR